MVADAPTGGEAPGRIKSIVESLHHAGIANDCRVKIELVEAELLEKAPDLLNGADGILIPGGFGNRGIPGKLQAIRHARENKIPLLGICLGLQCMAIEFARNVNPMSDFRLVFTLTVPGLIGRSGCMTL